MNTLTIVVIFIFLIFIMAGYAKGLFKTAFGLVAGLVSMILSYFIAPIVGGIIINNTHIDDYVYDRIYTGIEKSAEEKIRENITKKLEKETDGVMDKSVIDTMVAQAMKEDISKNEQINIIKNINVPAFIKDALIANNHDEMKHSLGVKSFYDYVAKYISYMLINALSFLLTFLIVSILIRVIIIIMGAMTQLPIVGTINRFGGMVFGAGEALIIVWIMFVVVTLLCETEPGGALYRQIEESQMLTYLYTKNVFLGAITNLSKII